jgi:TPR repeat protein
MRRFGSPDLPRNKHCQKDFEKISSPAVNAAWRVISFNIQPRWFCCLCAFFGLALMAQDAEKDRKWEKMSPAILESMAKDGNANAQNQLGLINALGKQGQTNYAVAREWFLKAAEQGLPEAQNNLASLYFSGRGLPRDVEEALRLYEKAAEQGFSQAQFVLGWIYASGVGVEPDYKKAVKWYLKAAERGDAQAQLSLGLLYLRGEDLKPDYIEAYKWVNLAAAQGHTNAIRHRRMLSSALDSSELRTAQTRSSQFLANNSSTPRSQAQ